LSAPPLIAVVGANKEYADKPDLTVPLVYLEAVERAGGRPAVLHPVELEGGAGEAWLAPFDGLILTGGGDLDPSFYGEAAAPQVYGVDAVRDVFELELARAALKVGKPLLAICRGIQVVNVALGGTLDQHIIGKPGIEAHGVPGGGVPVLHTVRVDPESELGRVMGVADVVSSCHHHQAIASLGHGLHSVAWTSDGIIEAVEGVEGLLAVQWHPEDTAADDPAQQSLFDSLVERARAKSTTTAGPGGP
jgi:putative glutamine amidotransferase